MSRATASAHSLLKERERETDRGKKRMHERGILNQ